MVLAAFDLNVTENELRARCDCNIFGTDALNAVEAVRQLGFPGTAKYTLTLPELLQLIDEDLYPVVYINQLPLEGIRSSHAVIVVKLWESGVIVVDPARGERLLPVAPFVTAWGMQRNLTLVIQR